MKKKIMQQWVAALRSGEFKQGKYRLESDDNYCCLGVLCVLAMNKGVCDYSLGGQYDGATHGPPDSVKAWSGLGSDFGRYKPEEPSLVHLNDSETPFSKIADIIETNWRTL